MQTVDYAYNIRGWLKAINDVNTIGTDLFAFKINYNDADTATDLYNGNISETFWKTSSDNMLRKYDYSYDHLNRLLQADYSKEGSATFNSYLEHLTYDKNGNIQTLLRNGEMDTDGYQFENPIDNLTYLYDDFNKNLLLRVFDATANESGFKDDTDGTDINIDINDAPDYAYDTNGNMISDTNKGITNIIYNHLNLPVEIVFPTGKINYIYNAVGQKVNKKVTEGSTINSTEYLSGFQYKNKVLQFFPHAEGYVNATGQELVEIFTGNTTIAYTFHYVFNFTDHLGNIRLSYSKDPATNVLKIIEENHYYPFGLKHAGYNSDQMMYSREGETTRIRPVPPLFLTSYKYKYNGKEYQDELGLNFYDYGARNYDPALGRWMNVDPLAENSRRWTPYNYAYNNPMYFVDPDGMQADDWKRDINGKMVYDKNLNQFNKSYTLGIGEQYVGSTHYEPTGTNTGLSYNEDGTIDNVTILNEIVVSASRPTGTTTDGLKVWGVGGDAIAGSGNMKGDRGSGSTAVGSPDRVTLLSDLGGLIGDAINYLFGDNKTKQNDTNATTMSTQNANTDSEMVKIETESSRAVPKVGNNPSQVQTFKKDTLVNKKDINQVRTNDAKEKQKAIDKAKRNNVGGN